MRLLIVTQTFDERDPLLGFFVRWVAEFSKLSLKVHVLALNVGEYSLPPNIVVHRLGKSEGKAKIIWLWRVWKISWQERHSYDVVFIHMNPEYVLAGGVMWQLLRKKVGLWYTHGSVSWQLRVATFLSHIIFTASAESFRLVTRKKKIIGHGIDVDHFKKIPSKQMFELVTVGRITPSKNIEAQLCMLATLKTMFQLKPVLTIVGIPTTTADKKYKQFLEQRCVELDICDQIEWYGATTQKDLPKILNKAKVFLHTAQNGSLDKVVLEAMACEIPVISTAPGVASLPFSSCTTTEPALVDTVKRFLESDYNHEVSLMRRYVCDHHSINSLIFRLIKEYEARV